MTDPAEDDAANGDATDGDDADGDPAVLSAAGSPGEAASAAADASPDRAGADGNGAVGRATGERVVVAQGTFDLLHPGHLHYLRDAAAMGDRLVVIVARSSNVTHKAPPVVPGPQRREVVAGLDPVDEARLGHPEDIFVPIEAIEPDVIALGYDQHHDEADIEAALADRGVDCEVRRASAYEPDYDGALLSTGSIIDRILAERD